MAQSHRKPPKHAEAMWDHTEPRNDPLSVESLSAAYLGCVERAEKNIAAAREAYPDEGAKLMLQEAEVSAQLAKAHATMLQANFMRPILQEALQGAEEW